MPTLGTLCGEPDFCLRLVIGTRAAAHRVVDSVRVVPGAAWSGDRLGDVRDALVVTGGPAAEAAGPQLLRELARQRAAGLAVVTGRHEAQAVPVVIRSAAARLNVPLLTTTLTPEAWDGLAPRLREYRFRHAEWHADQLTALLNRLPAGLADADADGGADGGAMQRTADWLASALDAEVLVSDRQRGVLAASPGTAPARLAPLLAGPAADDDSVHTRSVPLTAAGSAAVLSVASRRPFDEIGTDLTRHAAKVLGLTDQAARYHRQVADAERGVRLGAFQLLMAGEEVAAQRVLARLAPGLLATERIRVYVIDCAAEDREVAARHAESALAGRALLVRCPAFNSLIVLDPLRADDDSPGGVQGALRDVVAGLPGHHMGGSRVHPLGVVADAYTEAAEALATARQRPDRTALAEGRAGLLDVLPAATARRWATALLCPLLTLPASRRDQLLRTLDLGLDFRHTTAGRIVGVHRNTVTHRVSRAFTLLGLDRSRVLSQVAVSTALKIVGRHGHFGASADPTADFTEMVSTPDVRHWAESLLKPLRDDRRDLLRTLGAWLENDTHAQRTAAALALSPGTVRSHLRAAGPLLPREQADGADEHVLGDVRPLAFALYVHTGRPVLLDGWLG